MPKSSNLHQARAVGAPGKKQIGRLQIAVHDAGGVRLGDRLAGLQQVIDGLFDGQCAVLGHTMRQIVADQVLHHHVGGARVHGAHVDHAGYVLAFDAHCCARFTGEARGELWALPPGYTNPALGNYPPPASEKGLDLSRTRAGSETNVTGLMSPKVSVVLVIFVGTQFACSSEAPSDSNTAGGPSSSGSNAGGHAGISSGGGSTAGSAGAVATGGAGNVSGGAGGATGGSSTAGQSGSGGAAGGGSSMSPGCNKDVSEDPNAFTAHDITVAIDAKFDAAYGNRRYWTRPPLDYDKTKAWPLTIWGQGCQQGNSPEATPMTKGPAAAASIQVELLAPQNSNEHCYFAGPDGDDPKTPELPYFDKVLSEVLNNYCVDTSKVFMGGYSSGGWLSSLIACNRASKVRGVGWAAAGLQLNHDACSGPVAAIITRGTNDTGTPLAQTEAARDDLIQRNGCTTNTMPWLPGEPTFDSSSCVAYQGCMPGYPVVWCPTPGGHTNTVDDTKLTPQGFWKFWSTLP